MKILLFFIFCPLLVANFDEAHNGFGIDIGKSGSGVFFTRQILHESEIISFNGEVRLYDIKSSDESVYYNQFTGGYESIGGKSLFMVPIFLGANYYPFVGKIENNFSPFITARVGGVLSFDGKETGSFQERWEEPDIHLNQGGFLGLGIDFKMVGQTSVSVMLGIELLPLKNEIDQMQDYSGTLIHISFNRPGK